MMSTVTKNAAEFLHELVEHVASLVAEISLFNANSF